MMKSIHPDKDGKRPWKMSAGMPMEVVLVKEAEENLTHLELFY